MHFDGAVLFPEQWISKLYLPQSTARQVRGSADFGSDGSTIRDNGEESDGSNDSHSSESTADWLSSDSLSVDEGQ